MTAGAGVPAFRTLGHGTVLLPGPPAVVVDPWRWDEPDEDAAAIALITDARADHCSPEDLGAAVADGGPIVCPAAAAARLRGAFGDRVVEVSPGERRELAPGVAVRTFPAEAPARARGFLPRGAGVTYLVEAAGARWLFLGGSDALPEHTGLAPDVAFVAVGGFTVATAEEAADAVARIRPRLAVPTHWGDLSARFAAAGRFVDLCRERGVPAIPVRGTRVADGPSPHDDGG